MDKATTGESKEDGFEIFGRYVASELRTMKTPNAQRWAKLQIQNILYGAQAEPDPQPNGPSYSMEPVPGYNQFSTPFNFSGSPYPQSPSMSPISSATDWSSHHSHSPLPDHTNPANYTCTN